MDNSEVLTSEKIYFFGLRPAFIAKAVVFCLFATVLLIFINTMNDSFGMTKINLFIWLPIIFIGIVIVVFFQYWLNTRVFGGRIITKGNQKVLKQVTYILFPIVIIGVIIAIFFLPSERIRYINALPLLIFSWFLFYWRLRNKIKEEGQDNTPIFTPLEIGVIIFGILAVIGIFYFIYQMAQG